MVDREEPEPLDSRPRSKERASFFNSGRNVSEVCCCCFAVLAAGEATVAMLHSALRSALLEGSYDRLLTGG